MTSESSLPQWLSNAVLIYGPRKAGTTLLQNLHDGGNDLFVVPSELKLKFLLNVIWTGESEEILARYFKLSGILGREFPNFDREGYKEYAMALAKTELNSLKELIQRDVYGVYKNVKSKIQSPTMWAVKEVGGNTKRILILWRQMFLNGKVIMIVRDPLMITRSVLLDRRRRGIKLGVKDIYTQVMDPIQVISSQKDLLDAGNVHFLSYEELTSDPASIMRDISKFLGIEYHEKIGFPTIFGERIVVDTASRNTYDVFAPERNWYNGMNLKERFLVWIFSRWWIGMLRLLREKLLGRDTWSYSEIVKEIRTKRNSKEESYERVIS